MFRVNSFSDVERARKLLVGLHRGSKKEFAALLGYPSYGSIAVWKKRGSIPAWSAAQIESLMGMPPHTLAALKELRIDGVR